MAAARQGRELFKNSEISDFSVKPLLTFYGVASLCRSLVLLLKKNGGEESLTKGHGLETVSWSAILSGDISTALGNIGELKIRTCGGLFNDMMNITRNSMMMHVRSAAVDWQIAYPVPKETIELRLSDLLARFPDLSETFSDRTYSAEFASVNEMTFDDQNGFMAKIFSGEEQRLADMYKSIGYNIEKNGNFLTIRSPAAHFQQMVPQFIHGYIKKMFGSIPSLHICTYIPGNQGFSQITMTYLLSYCLGMLARYFPTQWIALVHGEKGDSLWPTINRAHHLVERSFPELVSEYIANSLAQSRKARIQW